MATGLKIELDSDALNRFLPMYMRINIKGTVTEVGSSLHKMFERTDFVGSNFFDLFEFRRPHGIDTVADLDCATQTKIVLNPRFGGLRRLPGLISKLGQNQGYLLNISLGLGLFRTLNEGKLHAKDFAPTDPSLDMMYLVEMQSALLEASRGLNNQLNGAKILAEEQALSDSLTGLNNRRSLRRFIQKLIDDDRSKQFSVVLIDLDFFKTINDTLGHAAGDFVLKRVARQLLSSTRPTDMVARVGGDEFVLVLPDFTEEKALEAFAMRIVEELSVPTSFAGEQCQIGASVGGIVTDGGFPDSVEQILVKSDEALYASKNAGRGRVTIASDVQSLPN